MARYFIGISGWRYKPWRKVWYPKDLPQARELEYASRQLPSIEINGSFYSLQRPSSYQQWHDATPDDFLFSLKRPRYITHIKRPREIEAPMANFFASGVPMLVLRRVGLRSPVPCTGIRAGGNSPGGPRSINNAALTKRVLEQAIVL